jgi:tRNA nucleotidyltransferase (CCA-adding enzyme)
MFFYQPNISDAAVRRLISKVGPENIPDLLELRRADIIATGKITTATHEYWRDLSERILAIVKTEVVNGSQNKLALNGHDLIEELGVNPGPIIGEIITRLWEEVFNDPALNRKDLLLDLARKYLDSKLQ